MPPSDLQKAASALIRSFGLAPSQAHSVYGQSRVNRRTGDVAQVLMVHKHPIHGRDLTIPTTFGGYPVEVHPWPLDEQS